MAIVNTSVFEGMPNATLEGWVRGIPALTLSYDPDGLVELRGLGVFARDSWEDFVGGARRLWTVAGRTTSCGSDVAPTCRRNTRQRRSRGAGSRSLLPAAANAPPALVEVS